MRIAPVLLLCVVACRPAPPPPGAAGPVEAVQELAAALQRGDPAAAYALLSKRTQREADEIAARARAAAPGAGGVPESGRQMLFSSALPQGKVQAREIARREAGGSSAGRAEPGGRGIGGEVAEVEVVDPKGQARTYRVAREGGVWKVDLDLLGKDAGR